MGSGGGLLDFLDASPTHLFLVSCQTIAAGSQREQAINWSITQYPFKKWQPRNKAMEPFCY